VLLDRALYLPEDWAGNAERRSLAGVPEEVAFATKPKLGRAMLERAVAAKTPCAWVAADSVYGGDYALRLWLERQPIGSSACGASLPPPGGRPCRAGSSEPVAAIR